jgi:N-glycosylase/DNA lyase
MNKLIKQINELRKNKDISCRINKQLVSFNKLGKKGNNEWFSELSFCILTANSKAQTAYNIQKLMDKEKPTKFLTLTQDELSKVIQENKHRFHNNKSKFIVEARKYKEIKTILKNEIRNKNDPRDFLIRNVKGIACKESSHFLRNVGFKNYAILDRHVLSLMQEHKFIKNKPKTLNIKNYLQIEKKLLEICNKTNMTQAELDMYLFYIRSGQILK